MPHWNNPSGVYEGPKDFRMINQEYKGDFKGIDKMTMIEKVTNAIRDSFNSNDIDCMPLAKAAIKAMKEPSEGMIACAESQFPLFADEYRRAIDAALNGK